MADMEGVGWACRARRGVGADTVGVVSWARAGEEDHSLFLVAVEVWREEKDEEKRDRKSVV